MAPELQSGEAWVRWAHPESLALEGGALENYLDAEERRVASRFHVRADASAYMAAHALLRGILSGLLARAPAALRFVPGLHGKPELDPGLGAGLHFSLSHTRGCAACAVTRVASVGVDVEDAQRDVDALELGRRTCTPHEFARLTALPPARRASAFLRSWTLKEATLKALGSGLFEPVEELEFEGHDEARPGAQIRLARAPGAIKAKERWHFEQRTVLDRYVIAVALPPREVVAHVDFREIRAL